MVLPFFNFKVSAQLNADKSNKQSDRTVHCNFRDTTCLLMGWMLPGAKKISCNSRMYHENSCGKEPRSPAIATVAIAGVSASSESLASRGPSGRRERSEIGAQLPKTLTIMSGDARWTIKPHFGNTLLISSPKAKRTWT